MSKGVKIQHINDKMEFNRRFGVMDVGLFDKKELNLFEQYLFYPVKEVGTDNITVFTSNEKLIEEIGKRPDVLKLFFKYLNKDQIGLITCNMQLYAGLKPQLSDENRQYSDEEASELFADILKEAAEAGSSDIHISWGMSDVQLKYRVDGEIIESLKYRKLNLNIAEKIKNIFINKSGEDEYAKNEVAGHFSHVVNYKLKNYRLSIVPTVYGYDIVLRDESDVTKTSALSQWGYSPEAIKILNEVKEIPYGLILVTGATGSGKSTLMYTIASECLREYNYIIKSVEDPVEIKIEGLGQVQVNLKGDKENWMTFKKAIKTFLRQDPDMIIVGEMRDLEVAQETLAAARTGHIALSTLHTNNVKATLSRLTQDMKIEIKEIEDALRCIVSQTLIPKLCKCKLREDIGGTIIYKRNPEGCVSCQGGKEPGYKGRLPVTEIAYLKQGKENWLEQNFIKYYTLEENIMYLVETGEVDKDMADRYLSSSTADYGEVSFIWNKITNEGTTTDKLFPLFQKIYDKENNMFAYEAYIRMRNENGDIIPPVQFIDFAKKKGFFNVLSNFIFDKIFEKMRGITHKVFVNIDLENIVNADFVNILFDKISKLGLKHLIILEINYHDSIEFIEFVRRANEENIMISIDNFNADIKSIIMLKKEMLKINYIKTSLDVRNIIALDKVLFFNYLNNVKTLTENIIFNFIETDDTKEFAFEVPDIKYLQGFLLHRPE